MEPSGVQPPHIGTISHLLLLLLSPPLADQGVASGQVHVAGAQAPAVGEAGVGVLATEKVRLTDGWRTRGGHAGGGTHLCALFGAFVQEVEGARSLHAGTTQDPSHMTKNSLLETRAWPPGSYPGLRGSCGPLPCSFFTSISLLRLRASRIFPKEPLRRREPLPSWVGGREQKA